MAGLTFGGRSSTPEPTLITERFFSSACSPKARDRSGNREIVDSLAPMCGLRAVESKLARLVRHPDAFPNSARLVRVSCLDASSA